MELVKFVAVGDTKNTSDYYKYVEKIMMDISTQGYTDSFQLEINDEYPNVNWGCIN